MDITELKSGFWGYKKSLVCEYIAAINEQFSQKLMETIQGYDRQMGELHAKITRLETENAVLREECDHVTQVLVDAKKFSDDLRVKAEAENKKFRDSNAEYNNEQQRRIYEFCVDIDKIRDSVRTMLESIDQELDTQKTELSAINSGLKELNSPEESAVCYEL